MQLITDPRNLPLTEIDYRIGGLSESHREILSHLIQGKSQREISQVLSISLPTLRGRILSACDHAGVSNRFQLVAMFTIYSCRMNITKLDFEKDFHTLHKHTEYRLGKLKTFARFSRIVTNSISKGLKLWTRKP
jgi:DNA-binding CsgD family transcriptional regulator